MADFGAPASANYNAPDGLQTLGNLMGLQSKKLTIQGQQQGLQGQAADVQMKQQDASQRQAASQFFQNFDLTKHVKDDGTLDLDSAMTSPQLKATGDAAPEIIKGLVGIKNQQLAAKQGLANLNSDLRGQFLQQVGGLAGDPDVQAGTETGRGKIKDAINQFSQSSPDAARIAGIYSPVIEKADGKKLTNIMRDIQLQGQSADRQAAATTVPANENIDTGGQVVTGTRAPALAGGKFSPTGTIEKQLSPTQKIDYIAASTGAAARAGGTASADIDRGNQISSSVQQSSAAIPLTERIDQLSHEIASGNLAKKISESGNWLGFSSVNEARSQLNKDLGQVKALAIQNAGSDSRAATVLEGYPTDTTPENTVHAAMDYIRGAAKQNLARGKLLSKYQQSDPSLKGFQAADNVLTGATNPLMHEYLSLKPEQQAGFYRRNFSTPQQAQEFKNQVKAIQQHTKIFDEQ